MLLSRHFRAFDFGNAGLFNKPGPHSEPASSNDPDASQQSDVQSNEDPNFRIDPDAGPHASPPGAGIEPQSPQRIGTIRGNQVIYIPDKGGAVVSGSSISLSQGGPAATVDGAQITVGSNGVIVEKTSVIAAPTTKGEAQQQGPLGLIATMDSQPVATGPSGEVIIGSVLLSKGGLAATIDGKVVSVDASMIILVGNTAIPLPKADDIQGFQW